MKKSFFVSAALFLTMPLQSCGNVGYSAEPELSAPKVSNSLSETRRQDVLLEMNKVEEKRIAGWPDSYIVDIYYEMSGFYYGSAFGLPEIINSDTDNVILSSRLVFNKENKWFRSYLYSKINDFESHYDFITTFINEAPYSADVYDNILKKYYHIVDANIFYNSIYGGFSSVSNAIDVGEPFFFLYGTSLQRGVTIKTPEIINPTYYLNTDVTKENIKEKYLSNNNGEFFIEINGKDASNQAVTIWYYEDYLPIYSELKMVSNNKTVFHYKTKLHLQDTTPNYWPDIEEYKSE